MSFRLSRFLPALALATACAACAPAPEPPLPVAIAAVAPAPAPAPAPTVEPVALRAGTASYYAKRMAGRRTASGEPLRQDGFTAAANLLPLGTVVTVTNRRNGQSVEVRINDRLAKTSRFVVDLTRAAAAQIGMLRSGTAEVEVRARPSRQPTPELANAVRLLASRD